MEEALVRRGTVADVPALAELRRAFTFEDDQEARPLRDDFDEAFTQIVFDGLATGRWVVWLAEVDGEIVSHAFVAVVEKIPRPVAGFNAIGYLTNVYTRPALRGRGLGGRVLAAVTQWACDTRVELLVVWPSEESVSFYGRHGFVDRGEPLAWLHPEAGE